METYHCDVYNKDFFHMNYVVMKKNQATLKVYKYGLVEIKV